MIKLSMTDRNVFNCEAFALQHITTLEEVKHFANYLFNGLGVNLHPDDDFAEYMDSNTGQPSFSEPEAATGNRLMNECFRVCEENGADIYDITFEVLRAALTEVHN
jgi:hypothetical protein